MSDTIATLACATCGEPAPAGGRFCEACGAELAPAVVTTAPTTPANAVHCPGCGNDPQAVDGYCTHCGMKQPDPNDHREVDLTSLAYVSDRGVRHHRNEDAGAIARVEHADRVVRILVVCDGVSSTSDSHLAAQGAAAAACAYLETVARDATTIDEAVLRGAHAEAVVRAQAAVVRVPGSGGENPSCTYVASVASDTAEGERLLVTAWLGDSRAYHLANETSAAISTDDSWATEQLAAGEPAATVWADPRAHSITRWLGKDASDLEPSVDVRVVPAIGMLLLCSDGLWNYAPSITEFRALIDARRELEPLALAQSLTTFAIDAGGHDNITVAIARLDR